MATVEVARQPLVAGAILLLRGSAVAADREEGLHARGAVALIQRVREDPNDLRQLLGSHVWVLAQLDQSLCPGQQLLDPVRGQLAGPLQGQDELASYGQHVGNGAHERCHVPDEPDSVFSNGPCHCFSSAHGGNARFRCVATLHDLVFNSSVHYTEFSNSNVH